MKEDLENSAGESEVPWLREMVEDELLGLFSQEKREVVKCARHLTTRAEHDSETQEMLLEAMRTSIIHQNDDTQASLWIALILGEIGDPMSLPVLFLGLGSEDESIQEASRNAILLVGPPAIEALMEEIEEEPSPEMVEAGYRLLGMVGNYRDRVLLERTMDFLADRVEHEVAKPSSECHIEALFYASALLGDRRMITVMDRILRERFKGKNTAIRDCREMLSENANGEPIIYERPPWFQESRWLFEEDLESSRIRGRRHSTEKPPSDEETSERRLSSLYWGLSSTLERNGYEPLDARRFIAHPDEECEETPCDECEELDQESEEDYL